MTSFAIVIDKTETTLVRVGYDYLARMGLLIQKELPHRAYVLITDHNVLELYKKEIQTLLTDLSPKGELIALPPGEEQKQIFPVTVIINRLVELGVDRETLIIALGGGVVGDIAGFVAAIYMRGLSLLHIPTTLTAQTDSSLGGKNALDLPGGKNMVGTIRQPQAVFIDLKFLSSLPAAEWQNGLAEVAKYGLLEGGEYFSLLESQSENLRERRLEKLEAVIAGACRIKKNYVEIDEQDRHTRRFLNLGHTLGHALEAASGYAVSHGQAVALGLRGELALSRRLLHLPEAQEEKAQAFLDSLGLPRKASFPLDRKAIVACLKMDKKRESGQVRFILLKNIGQPFLAAGIPEAAILSVIEEIQ
jgi:3-dehydroquinate synthase